MFSNESARAPHRPNPFARGRAGRMATRRLPAALSRRRPRTPRARGRRDGGRAGGGGLGRRIRARRRPQPVPEPSVARPRIALLSSRSAALHNRSTAITKLGGIFQQLAHDGRRGGRGGARRMVVLERRPTTRWPTAAVRRQRTCANYEDFVERPADASSWDGGSSFLRRAVSGGAVVRGACSRRRRPAGFDEACRADRAVLRGRISAPLCRRRRRCLAKLAAGLHMPSEFARANGERRRRSSTTRPSS